MTLDLHGYKTDEVFDAVDSFIVRSQKKGLHSVRLMTGKGTGAVQKKVIEYLRLGGYPYKFEKQKDGKANEGVLVAQI